MSTNKIELLKINYDNIPDHEADDLAAATLDAVKRFIMTPGGKEALETRIKAKKESSDSKPAPRKRKTEQRSVTV